MWLYLDISMHSVSWDGNWSSYACGLCSQALLQQLIQ